MAGSGRSGARTLFWIGLVLLLLGFAPLIIGFVSMTIANMAGCSISEGYSPPCMIMGSDWSETLQSMLTMIWFMFFTFLLIPVGAIVWLVAFIGWLKNRGSSGA